MKSSNPGHLPSSKGVVEYPGVAGSWQVINIAHLKNMALVKVGAGIGLSEIVGISGRRVVAIGGVIERMTVSIGYTEVQSADGSPQRHLQGVVRGIRLRFKKSYSPVTANRPVRVWIGTASDGQVVGGPSADCLSVYDERRARAAEGTGERLSRMKGILRQGNWRYLIQVPRRA